MITEALKSLSYNRITKIGLILFGIVLAPFMFIFQFKESVFWDSDFVKLLLISTCFGLPAALILFILRVIDDAGLDPESQEEKMRRRFSQMASTSVICGVGFYIPCCIKFFQPALNLRDAIGLMIPFYGAILVMTVLSISRGGTKALRDRLVKHLENNKKSKP
jgi:hypothetical protein